MPVAGAFGYLRATPRIGPLIALTLVFAALLAPAAHAEAVPLIVDTDMYSDPDDVGALATAFGLQNKGEAKVIALAVNTRTSRPTVEENSWKCVAAVAAFYGSASVPIGTSMPDDGTLADPDWFATSCAAHGPAAPPAPEPALDVYRSALAGQPDGSVVIVSIGYMGNLAKLLDAEPALVAQKVKRLVVMGGGYQERPGETNLQGDPSAAQDVAAHWPTKVVWSGFEIGEVVQTGHTISKSHPADSPVRAAYETTPGAGKSIRSFDLTAVYHAVRPDDPLLREVGPGTNTITDKDTGANRFVMGAGDQYYLELTDTDEAGLESSIESLLDSWEPPPKPPPPAPAPVQAPVQAADSAPQAAPPAAPQPAAEASAPSTALPSKPAPGCVVPTLNGRTLAGARKLLAQHRCTLGPITRARGTAPARLRVSHQSLVPRGVHRTGTRVWLTLR